MTDEERKMLNMSEEEFNEFIRTQPIINGMFVMKADDYIAWLKRNKNIEVSESTVRNKIKEGSITSKQHTSFYPENNGVTQGSKTTKRKYPTFIVMDKKTMEYNGYNDGSKQGKPIRSVAKKKERLKKTAEMMKERGIDME